MAETDIRKFRFGDSWKWYEWKNADFLNFQDWIFETIGGLFEGMCGASVLTGLQVTPLSGMTVRVSAGIAVTASGELLVNSANVDVTMTSPVGNPAKSYLVIRPKKTNMTLLTKPLIPTESDYLHELQGMEIVEIAGTPAGSPVYPSKLTDDVVIMGFNFGAGHATVTYTDFDAGEQERPNNRRDRVGKKSANYTATVYDNKIEMNCAAGVRTITLPDAAASIGKEILVIKTDSSANKCTVQRSGSDTIGGGTSFDLPAQWDFVRLYSDGISDWRIV
jgi:hypothetical protein